MNFWIAGTLLLSLISPVFYTRSMMAGKSKPHRVTRLIVWLAAVAGLLGVIHSTNLAGIIFASIFFARATYLLIMSLIYGVGGASRLDKSCLVIGVAALVLYAVTGNGLLAISFGILADFIGYIPTFVKTWYKPESEDPTFFLIEGGCVVIGCICDLGTAGGYTLPDLFCSMQLYCRRTDLPQADCKDISNKEIDTA